MKRTIVQFMEGDQLQNICSINTAEFYSPSKFLGCIKSTSYEGMYSSPCKPKTSAAVIHVASVLDVNNRASMALSEEQVQNIRRESHYFNQLFESLLPDVNSKEGITVQEEYIHEASYVIEVLADLTEDSDLNILPWKFNIILAKLSAKWSIPRFIDYFTSLMDRELTKVLDIRSCDIILVSGEHEGVFVPHPRKPNSYLSKKQNKASSIELISIMTNNNIPMNCWELTICIRKPDGNTAVGRMAFPCKEDTMLKDCSGSWDGHDLKFKLGTRDEKYIRAFVTISELILSYDSYQHGMIIRGKEDIVKILQSHSELWTKTVFDKLFSREELTSFLLHCCQPKP